MKGRSGSNLLSPMNDDASGIESSHDRIAGTSVSSFCSIFSSPDTTILRGVQSSFRFRYSATQVRASSTGTSTSGPMVAARAWSESTPYTALHNAKKQPSASVGEGR